MKALLALDEMKPVLPTVAAIVLIGILEIIIGERTVLADTVMNTMKSKTTIKASIQTEVQ